jgi:hypothetical protein
MSNTWTNPCLHEDYLSSFPSPHFSTDLCFCPDWQLAVEFVHNNAEALKLGKFPVRKLGKIQQRKTRTRPTNYASCSVLYNHFQFPVLSNFLPPNETDVRTYIILALPVCQVFAANPCRVCYSVKQNTRRKIQINVASSAVLCDIQRENYNC